MRGEQGQVGGVQVGEVLQIDPKLQDSDTDEGLGLPTKSKVSRVKQRRVRRKAFRPYYKLSEEERAVREEREKMREVQLRQRMLAKGRITAPYNTTQFLMSDKQMTSVKPRMRGREESCSAESDEHYYSPSDDEEDFICREFRKDYEGEHVNQLDMMSKEMLLAEYMLIERKNEGLEARLEGIRMREEEKMRRGEVDYDFYKGEVPMEPEMAAKIGVFQSELQRLRRENSRLREENKEMKERLRNDDSESSSSSDSSSDSSSGSSSDDSDDSSDEEELKEVPDSREGVATEDTGYESTQSKEEVTEPTSRTDA